MKELQDILSRPVTSRECPIQQLRTDGGTQSRCELDQDTVADYAGKLVKGVRFPAIQAVIDHEGTIWVWDGYHRIEAYIQADETLIEVETRPGTRRDAILLSLGANETHGLRRKPGDRRKAVLTMLADPLWSHCKHVEIATACGVDESYVRRIRMEVEARKSAQATQPPAPSAPVTPSLFSGPFSMLPPVPGAGGGRREPGAASGYISGTFITDTPSEITSGQSDCQVGPASEANWSGESALEQHLGQGQGNANDGTPVPESRKSSSASAPDADDGEFNVQEHVSRLPLAQALAGYPHGGLTYKHQAIWWYALHGSIKKLRHEFLRVIPRHSTGPFVEEVRRLTNIPDPLRWEGCPACKGATRTPLGEKCNFCEGGFVFESGLPAQEVYQHAENMRLGVPDN